MNDFTMVVSEALPEGSDILMIGRPKGEIKAGEEIYVCTTDGKFFASRADVVQKSENDPESISIKAALPEGKVVTHLAVVSTIAPTVNPRPGVALENPFLMGLAREIKIRHQEKEFNSALIYGVVHSMFMLPAKFDGDYETDENGGVKINRDTRISYATLPAADDRNKKVLALYTDERALNEWIKRMGDVDVQKSCMVLPFPAIYGIMKDSKLAGLVVNPFSEDANVYLKGEMLDSLVKSDVYKRDMASMAVNTGLRIGAPVDSPEVRKIRQILMDYGVANSKIDEIYLFLRIEGDRKSYVVPFSCEGEPREFAKEMGEALKPVLENITNVSFGPIDLINSLDSETVMEGLVHRRV